MTVKAIDPWVNVSMGAMADTPFMQKVKEEYFKAGDDFFRNIEADELIELMDGIGVEKAFLTADPYRPEQRLLDFTDKYPGRFYIAAQPRIKKGMKALWALEDPEDADADGISGRVHVLSDGRVGKLGWKADVPTLADFTRDAGTNELGLTLDAHPTSGFGRTEDDDGVADPEFAPTDADDLTFYMTQLAPPPAGPDDPEGEALFDAVGCASCHVPELPHAQGPLRAYTDLLLHRMAGEDTPGIPSQDAGPQEFRTAPLWGIATSAPYLHDGRADTLHDAIEGHGGEAEGAKTAYQALTLSEQQRLLDFLGSR